MADWAIKVDGSCDFLVGLDFTNTKVITMNEDVRIFVKVIKKVTGPKQVITWGEKKGVGIFISAHEAVRVLKRRRGDARRSLRLQMPKNDGMANTNLFVNARMKNLSLKARKTASLENLGYTDFKKVQGEPGETVWAIVSPVTERQ